MASSVGSLHVDLGLNSAQFHAGIAKAQAGLSGFSRHAGKIGAAIGITLAAIPAALATGLKSAINAADDMGKAAQKVGLTTEELSKLKYAAQLSDVSFESLQSGLVRLSRAMSEVAQGSAGPAKQAFDALGISVKNADGSMKSGAVVMSELSEKFSGYADGVNKTALAVAIFGRAGANMIPLLNSGATGLASAGAEAEKLGLVISGNTAKAAENFNDNLTRLGALIQGGFIQAMAMIAPTMDTLSSAFIDGAKEANLFERAGAQLASMLDGLARFAATTREEVARLAAVFNYIKTLATTNVGPGFFDREAAAAEKGRSAIKAAGDEYARTIKRLDAPKSAFGALSIGGSFNNADGIDGLRAALAKKIDAPALTKPIAAVGNAGKAAATKMTEAEREISRAYQKLKTESETLYESTRTPLEAFRDQLEKLKKMLNPGDGKPALISADTYTRGIEAAQKKLNEAIISGSELAQTLQSNFNSMFDSFLNGTFKAKDAIKKLLGDLAKMAMNKLFTQLLGSVFGGGGGGGLFSNLLGGAGKNANGTNNWRGGMTWVGERGKELVNLPRGSQVIPNRSIGGVGGGSTLAPVYNIDARGAQMGVAEQISAAMQENNRVLQRNMSQLLIASSRRHM